MLCQSINDLSTFIDTGNVRQEIVDFLLCLCREKVSGFALCVGGQDAASPEYIFAHCESQWALLPTFHPFDRSPSRQLMRAVTAQPAGAIRMLLRVTTSFASRVFLAAAL